MGGLLQLCWRLTMMRAGPQDMPVSAPLLAMLCVLVAGVNTLARIVLALNAPGSAVLSTLSILAVWSLVVAALLKYKGVPERFLQTFAALMAVDLVMTLLSAAPLAIALWVTPGPFLAGFLQATLLTCFVWDMLAKGAVYRQSMNLGHLLGNLLAMCIAFSFMYLDSLWTGGLSSPVAR